MSVLSPLKPGKTASKPSLVKKSALGDNVERSLLAFKILTNPNITIASEHVSKIADSANARANLFQTLTFRDARQSCYQNAPCGQTEISLSLMKGMLALAQIYSFHVTEIAGGSHSKNSRHYAGIAMDIDSINNDPVSAQNKHVSAFMKKCKELGATEVLGPGTKGHAGHIHAAWPRK